MSSKTGFIDRTSEPVVVVEGVSKAYGRGSGRQTVLSGISFQIEAGSTLAIVGESGSGKSTTARLVAGLEPPTQGTIRVAGALPRLRPGKVSLTQMVFQNPTEALNPLISIGESIAEPLRGMSRSEREQNVAQQLDAVGVAPARMSERPRQFSGGQLQRIVVARALAGRPKVLICDEPTSALDVSVQARLLNLLLDLQDEHRFAMLLVTHELAVAKVLADSILLLKAGKAVEAAPAESFFREPGSVYGRELLSLNEAAATKQPLSS